MVCCIDRKVILVIFQWNAKFSCFKMISRLANITHRGDDLIVLKEVPNIEFA